MVLITKIQENYIIRKVAKAVEMRCNERNCDIQKEVVGQTQDPDSTALD